MALSKKHCRAARALLGWKQADLAKASGLSVPTIENFESGKSTPHDRNIVSITEAFERGGIVFLDANEISREGGAGMRLRK